VRSSGYHRIIGSIWIGTGSSGHSQGLACADICGPPLHAGSSAQGSCGGKASIRGGCSAIDTKQAEGQDTQLGECSTSQATDAAVRPNLECSSRPVRLAEPPFSTDLPRALGNNRQLLSSSSKLRRRRLPHLSIEVSQQQLGRSAR